MTRLLTLLFGCRHRRLTWPLTVGGQCWRTCVTCGKMFTFDWETLRVTGAHK